MSELESKLDKDLYLCISPDGISDFNLDKLKDIVSEKLFLDEAGFGILLEDEQKRKTELFAVLRHFNKKAQQKKPVTLPVSDLYDDGFTFSNRTFSYLGNFFRSLAVIDPPSCEFTEKFEGTFKKGVITRIMPKGQWWKHLFVDVYTENQNFVEEFKEPVNLSKKILKKNNEWKRYRAVKRYLKNIKENNEYLLFNSQESKTSKLSSEDLYKFMNATSKYLTPLFSSKEEYTYFLLGFYHANNDLESMHKGVVRYFKELGKIETYIEEFNSKVKSSLYSRINDIKYDGFRKERIFGSLVNEKLLDEVYENVSKNGANIESPLKISQDLWNLSFFPLERNLKSQPTNASYAFVKIKNRKEQLNLFHDHLKLKEDYTLNKISSVKDVVPF